MNLVLLGFVGAALAAEPAGYARSTALSLPEQGAAVIDLTDVQIYPNRNDLLLLNGQGEEVPWTLLGSWQDRAGGIEEVEVLPIGTPPRSDRVQIDTREIGRGIDELVLDVSPSRGFFFGLFASGSWAVEVQVLDSAGVVQATELLWRAEVGGRWREHDSIRLPDLPPGVYELRAESPLHWDSVSVSWVSAVDVEPLVLTLPVTGPVPRESGVSVYEVQLPAAGLELEHLALTISDERYLRQVTAFTTRGEYGVQLSEVPVGEGLVERLELGNSRVSHTELELSGGGLSDRLTLVVQDGRDKPLNITQVTLTLRNRHLLVTDAGPGPHTLYAAPVVSDRGSYDLVHASAELLKSNPPLIQGVTWGPNPSFNPADLLPSAILRGAKADTGNYKLYRELTGPGRGQGARWVIPPELLARPGANLFDVRIVDAEGFQVPYLVDRSGLRPLTLTTTRVEENDRTRITVTLPATTTVELLRLRCDSPVFSRQVVAMGQGSATWVKQPEDSVAELFISSSGGATDRIEILIQNGDDQPLGDITVEAFGPVISLVAVDPGPGARLLYSGPSDPPDYDLSMVSQILLNGVLAEGSMGPEQGATRASALDKKVGLVVVAGLALGLLFLAFRLLRDPEPPGDAANV